MEEVCVRMVRGGGDGADLLLEGSVFINRARLFLISDLASVVGVFDVSSWGTGTGMIRRWW